MVRLYERTLLYTPSNWSMRCLARSIRIDSVDTRGVDDSAGAEREGFQHVNDNGDKAHGRTWIVVKRRVAKHEGGTPKANSGSRKRSRIAGGGILKRDGSEHGDRTGRSAVQGRKYFIRDSKSTRQGLRNPSQPEGRRKAHHL